MHFIHYWTYLDVLPHAVAFLDTFPYGGCLTSLEAMSRAIPIVSLPSAFARGRFTMALLRQMGVTDTLARSPEDYAKIALRLATEPDFREGITARMSHGYEAMHNNFDAALEWAQTFLVLAWQSRQ